ncbi:MULTISPECIES: anti-sigma factor antagonist [unclassified Streptomyces]|uniref:anti-sigma factor antagonist n=1 Tax=unclassified Streptomyces TaxID=2593676 RepID=UPI002E2A465C|nr:anti-sigma factor antagonist [Streptomyces sp. NBC_00285]
MDLHLETSQPREDVLVISIEGEVDVYTAPQLRDCFREQLQVGGTWGHVVLECSKVSFFDSTAIGVSVFILKSLRRRSPDGQLAVVVAAGGKIEKIMRITGLSKVYRVFESMDSCLAGLTPASVETPAA